MHSNRTASVIRTLAVTIVATSICPVWAGSLTPRLEEALIHAGPDDRVPVVVLMEAFPAQDELLAEVHGLNRADRRARVVSILKDNAERNQAPIHAALAIDQGVVRDVRVLWGVNGIALEATPGMIQRLARLPGVERVLYDHATGHLERVEGDSTRSAPERGDGAGPTGGDTSGPNPDATVRGEVIAMGAQQVWDELGYTGAGTDRCGHRHGNRSDPPRPGRPHVDQPRRGREQRPRRRRQRLHRRHLGLGLLHSATTTRAEDSHGTQVAGQVAGDGTNGTVTGMAPDAELMALGIDCDTPSRGWEASDYAIEKGAHIITQSYSWWWTDLPDYEAFRRQTDTELAAGVIHANSAGNHGGDPITYPVPYNISTPANCPAPWIHPDQTLAGGISGVLGIGNISWSDDLIAFSARLAGRRRGKTSRPTPTPNTRTPWRSNSRTTRTRTGRRWA